jgi:hypothetical protein
VWRTNSEELIHFFSAVVFYFKCTDIEELKKIHYQIMCNHNLEAWYSGSQTCTGKECRFRLMYRLKDKVGDPGS